MLTIGSVCGEAMSSSVEDVDAVGAWSTGRFMLPSLSVGER